LFPLFDRAGFPFGLIALCGLLDRPQAAKAGSIDLTTEVMIEEQSTDAYFLGGFFGVDPDSLLAFTSFVDPSTASFTYSTVLGTMFLGQSLTLTGSGTVDGSGNYDVAANGDLGGFLFQILGKEKIIDNGDGTTTVISDDDVNDAEGNKISDKHFMETVTDTTSSGVAWLTNADGSEKTGSRRNFKDELVDGEWKTTILPDPSLGSSPSPIVVSSGYSPPGGGAGSFTTSIMTTEPSQFSLLLIGAFCLIVRSCSTAGFFRRD